MPFKNGDEIVAAYNAIHEKMKPNLLKLFENAPKTSFEVRRIILESASHIFRCGREEAGVIDQAEEQRVDRSHVSDP